MVLPLFNARTHAHVLRSAISLSNISLILAAGRDFIGFSIHMTNFFSIDFVDGGGDVIGFVVATKYFLFLLEASVQTTFVCLYMRLNVLCVHRWIKSCVSPTAILNGD